MKLVIEGATARDLADQCLKFANELVGEHVPAQTVLPVNPPNPTVSNSQAQSAPAEKRGRGRPPKVEPSTPATTSTPAPTSIAPVAPAAPAPTPAPAPAPVQPVAAIVPEIVQDIPPKVFTKQDIVEALQKLASHVATASAGTDSEKNASGINAVRSLLNDFGVKKVGDLDEKRYAEFIQKCEEKLK